MNSIQSALLLRAEYHDNYSELETIQVFYVLWTSFSFQKKSIIVHKEKDYHRVLWSWAIVFYASAKLEKKLPQQQQSLLRRLKNNIPRRWTEPSKIITPTIVTSWYIYEILYWKHGTANECDMFGKQVEKACDTHDEMLFIHLMTHMDFVSINPQLSRKALFHFWLRQVDCDDPVLQNWKLLIKGSI